MHPAHLVLSFPFLAFIISFPIRGVCLIVGGLSPYLPPFAGHSLVTTNSSKMLGYAVFHACFGRWSWLFRLSFHLTNMMIGWSNLFQKGYLHRDVSIGNVVIVEDAVTTQAFGILKNKDRNAKLEDIMKALQVLKIHSFVKATFWG